MDFVGYYEIPSCEKMKEVSEYLMDLGFKYSDSGFCWGDYWNGDKLNMTDNPEYTEYEEYIARLSDDKGHDIEWVSEDEDDIVFSISCVSIKDKKYVLYRITQKDFIIWGTRLDGRKAIINVFLNLYVILEAKTALMNSETEEWKFINKDRPELQDEVMSGARLVINPGDKDLAYFINSDHFERKKRIILSISIVFQIHIFHKNILKISDEKNRGPVFR